MADSSTPSCGMCCHCANGIAYGRYYYFCLYCSLILCTGCQSKHPRSHVDGFRRCMDKTLPRDVPDSAAKECKNCEKKVLPRIECNSCDIILCQPCWGEHHQSFLGHEHKGITFHNLPDEACLQSYELECSSCMLGSSLTHCSRCLEGVMEGETFYECKGCLDRFDLTNITCESCFPAVQAQHTPGHQFSSYVYRENARADEKHCSCICLECSKDNTEDPKALVNHEHSKFQVNMGCIERQSRAHLHFRKCPRHPVKNIDRAEDELYGDGLGCQCCWEPFPKKPKTYLCRTCEFSVCANCFEQGIANHPHQMYLTWYQRTVPGDDFWKKLITQEFRGCDGCKDNIKADIESHLRCSYCDDFDLCMACAFKPEISVKHGTCAERVVFNFWDPKTMGDEWTDNQVKQAKDFIAECEREEQEQQAAEAARRKREEEEAAAAAAAAEAAKRRAAQTSSTVSRKPVGTTTANSNRTNQFLGTPTTTPRVRAPSPAPPRSTNLAPPQKQAQRRKSSSGLGSFLKGALQVTNAVLQAENRVLAAQNGGGGGGNFNYVSVTDTSSSSMDMSSFWAPIQSAASDPIQ